MLFIANAIANSIANHKLIIILSRSTIFTRYMTPTYLEIEVTTTLTISCQILTQMHSFLQLEILVCVILSKMASVNIHSWKKSESFNTLQNIFPHSWTLIQLLILSLLSLINFFWTLVQLFRKPKLLQS